MLEDVDVADWMAAGQMEPEVIAAEETGAALPHQD
jgi:hypothetical protein